MAKGKGSIQGWITKNGVHIPIYGTYTVREGHEPTVKGAKWKKKRPDNLRAKDIHGQERLINRKDLEDALAEVKSKAKNATNEHEWRQYEDEAKEIQKALDGKEVSPLVANNYGKLSAKKKPSMSEEDKTARTVADHYGVSVDKAKEGIASGKYSDDDIKTAKDYKATMKNLEDKRDAGSISAEDYESARKDAIKGFNESRKERQESSRAANGAPRVSDEEAKSNKMVDWNGGQYQTQPVVDWDNEKNQEYVAGHLYVPHNPKNGEKQFFVAQDGSIYNSGSEYLRQKNSKGQESSASDLHSRIQAQAEQADVHRQRTSVKKASVPESYPERKRYKSEGVIQAFKSAKEMTGRSDLTLHQLAQDGLEDHYAFRDKDGNEIGRFSNPHTSRAGYMTLNVSATGDRSKPIKKGGIPTTVSGLRSAYAEATGSEKAKISAELRRKGYSLVGGKWVKGSKS